MFCLNEAKKELRKRLLAVLVGCFCRQHHLLAGDHHLLGVQLHWHNPQHGTNQLSNCCGR
jgi:hypothetical protein